MRHENRKCIHGMNFMQSLRIQSRDHIQSRETEFKDF